jgi:hypothetical protein
MLTNDISVSLPFGLAIATLIGLSVEAAFKLTRAWAIPSLVAYATVFSWYLLEPFYFPESFLQFGEILDSASIQVIIFLVAFRVAIVPFTKLISPPPVHEARLAQLPAETVVIYAAILWVCLLAIGVYRLDGDLLTALFPLESRAGGNMWSRAAAGDAGSGGFLVSTGSYLYGLVAATFGILLPFFRHWQGRLFTLTLVALSWPYFLLNGSRNTLLAVLVPSVVSYALFSSHSRITKILTGTALAGVVDVWFRVVIAYRNVGFDEVFDRGLDASIYDEKHVGLNMMSELCFMNAFYDNGSMQLSWGLDYLKEIANAVPRFIWPDKPLLGIDYALLRGFGGSSSDIGAVATISRGIIGQGFENFGPILGPLVAAILFAIWAAFLARLKEQQGSVLRLSLFLLGLGITFNMGRDLTLLVLWPMIFGYVIVRFVESLRSPRAVHSAKAQR